MKIYSPPGIIMALITPLLLTGCPGDKFLPDETTSVFRTSEGICFKVFNAQDYQPAVISIAPRGTPSDKRWYKFQPQLKIENGRLCIPPSFYQFPENGAFLVDYVLTAKTTKHEPRSVVVGFDLFNGHPYGINLSSSEISRPYREE